MGRWTHRTGETRGWRTSWRYCGPVTAHEDNPIAEEHLQEWVPTRHASHVQCGTVNDPAVHLSLHRSPVTSRRTPPNRIPTEIAHRCPEVEPPRARRTAGSLDLPACFSSDSGMGGARAHLSRFPRFFLPNLENQLPLGKIYIVFILRLPKSKIRLNGKFS